MPRSSACCASSRSGCSGSSAVPSGAAPATVAAQPAAAALPDYFAFESRMRASTDEIRRRQRPYVDDFRDAAPVLDVGCGRGEFLGAAAARPAIEARGVDADADMVAFARGEGLDVEQADVARVPRRPRRRLARRRLRRASSWSTCRRPRCSASSSSRTRSSAPAACSSPRRSTRSRRSRCATTSPTSRTRSRSSRRRSSLLARHAGFAEVEHALPARARARRRASTRA